MTQHPPPPAPQDATLRVPVVLGEPAALPSYAHPGDAGADLTTREDVVVAPGARVTVPTGVSLALPAGYAAFVVPRSGLAAKRGLTVLNAPGTVDAGYRGEIRVTLLNTDAHEPVELRAGDRVAQVVVQRVERVDFVPVDSLEESVRGTGGFGSSGGAAALVGAEAPLPELSRPVSSGPAGTDRPHTTDHPTTTSTGEGRA